MFGPKAKDKKNIKWDSTWSYLLKIKGYNNLTHPIWLDSVLIIDDISKTLISTCRCNHIFIKDKNEFTYAINIKNGNGSQSFPVEYPYFSRHNSIADSLLDIRFNTHSFVVKLFTSVDSKELKVGQYIVFNGHLH